MNKLPNIFQSYKPYIEKELKEIIGKKTLPFYNMLRYHMGWVDEDGNEIESSGGKYLRATLCLLACQALSGNYQKALPLAAAIELVHNFSLVHDDIQDGDLQRRHKPTVWSVWGKPQAINAGSAMRVMATLSILKLEKFGILYKKQIAAINILDSNCLKMIEGQYLDIDYETREHVSLGQYLDMIKKKTAALIQASIQMGAVINIGGKSLEEFKNLGLNIGLAFQIKDDVLGIWGNDKKTGKPKGNDIKKKKKSFPIVFCLENSNKKIRKIFLNTYRKKKIKDGDVKSVLELLDRVEAKKYSDEMALKYYKKALDNIEKLPIDAASKGHFEDIARFLVLREF